MKRLEVEPKKPLVLQFHYTQPKLATTLYKTMALDPSQTRSPIYKTVPRLSSINPEAKRKHKKKKKKPQQFASCGCAKAMASVKIVVVDGLQLVQQVVRS